MTVVTMGWKQWINGQAQARRRAEKKLKGWDNEEAVRHMIRTGRAEKMADGYYRIEMPGATYIYGAEYVERIRDDGF